MATAAGTEAIVCSGVRPEALPRALAGSAEGTRFAPRALGVSSFKLWLKYAKPSKGTLVVDAGAARALRDEDFHAALAQVHRLAAALDPVADDRDGLAFQGRQVRIFVVIHARLHTPIK
jgi:glutamate 5-kinase